MREASGESHGSLSDPALPLFEPRGNNKRLPPRRSRSRGRKARELRQPSLRGAAAATLLRASLPGLHLVALTLLLLALAAALALSGLLLRALMLLLLLARAAEPLAGLLLRSLVLLLLVLALPALPGLLLRTLLLLGLLLALALLILLLHGVLHMLPATERRLPKDEQGAGPGKGSSARRHARPENRPDSGRRTPRLRCRSRSPSSAD